ncbi:MAG TPA: twin-arginine translocase TatA/TatE family subunit [Anaerolineae bacterium]
MFGLQPPHLILIAIIALLIFGPARFTDLGRSVGRSISEFRSASKEESIDPDSKPARTVSKDRGNP